MNAIQQKCRPKHQVLVLKCYPRTTKGAVDVKPNSSELSYLLYYATSRRSKIQKIGAFLEKKTASDVWRLRIGNVQVTLQILSALMEKLHKDSVLIAPFVLKILDTVLRSDDITMIESSLPTFAAFCDYHDAAFLLADQAYLRQYEEIVRLYVQLASTKPAPGKESLTTPVKVRWRNAGLEAIRSISTADALSSITGSQMDVIMPRILENLWSETPDFLETLHQRLETEEKVDTEKQLRRRTSIATVGTDGANDPNPVALSGTAGDVDKLAEEEVGVLALQCLKSIFIVPTRSQIHGATVSLLRFIREKVAHGNAVVELHDDRERDSGWAISIYGIISRWAPVQDRYTILVAALETLLRIPVQDSTLDEQLALVTIMSSLLRSDVNLIGLSMMDVLLGLIKQMRKLFRMRTPTSQSDDGNAAAVESESVVRQKTKHLVGRLELCIGDLATHVYYADQISDMISAIILRLKPSRSVSVNSSPGGEKNGNNEAGPGASTIELSDSQQLDHYFSLNTGRASGLRAIKEILLVANPQKKLTGNMGLSRNPVPIYVWEGTHWLLRDPDGHVRKAYMDALITWLDRETSFANEIAVEEKLPRSRSSLKINKETRRAVSNASHRERGSKPRHSQFLALLHLVIYDNALQYVEYENDLVMLHILLTRLVLQLGVNAARYGLPMIYRLQEDIQEIDTPLYKVRTAALCHGYFWALTEKFDFKDSDIGIAIEQEVARRRRKGFWVQGITMPPPEVDTVGLPGEARPQPDWDSASLEREELLPFDDREALVECIVSHYHDSLQAPPGSPGPSPGRVLSGPILGSTLTGQDQPDSELPAVFREQMLADWTRDAAGAMLAAAGKSESLTGSKTETSGTHRGHLTVKTNGNGFANGNGPTSPYGSQYNLMRPHSSHGHREKDREGTIPKHRKSSLRSAVSPAHSTGNRGTVASVDQLKLVLSGNPPPKTAIIGDDDSGDSMVSYDYSPSEMSFNPATQNDQPSSPTSTKRPGTASKRGPLSAHPPLGGAPDLHDDNDQEDEAVPPVPPLPDVNLLGGKRSPIQSIETSFQDKSARRSLTSRGGDGTRPKSVRSQNTKTMDLQDLLRGIDSRPSEGSLGNVTKPPY
ncbi:protein EFR3 [Fusarium oxysporum f. sp. lycopersici 4287]|uniref:Protein EFR3 n=3 Tax=Fusarium oxysporum TaxID=5507 RepID=A0A0J9UKH4_FUSO4|nr:protein EFR3 [Fusarium oxysporum f. sp. lycopersici 4287]EXK31235.1 protein EFR3 [Fusarium oxysporum f. sp. melonis 26406]KAJ9420393.1 protein EFR3 [Fusarium oxysporum]KNA99694.1 protein EFR3 [Fusarium oxysporum f. sp. lycopersici 4287]